MPSPGPARHPFRARIKCMPVQWTISHTGRPVVAASDSRVEQAETFAAAATARRPLAIFRELHHARQWLDAQSLPDD